MTRPILLLARLNDADLALDATKARLAEIVEAARKPAELVKAEEALAIAEKEVARLRGEQAQVEMTRADAESKIEQIETRLYDGKITNSRELENSQRDLAQHRSQKTAVEDRLLEIMVAMEAAMAALNNAQVNVKRFTEEWTSRQSGSARSTRG
jgi:uncharacterized protein